MNLVQQTVDADVTTRQLTETTTVACLLVSGLFSFFSSVATEMDTDVQATMDVAVTVVSGSSFFSSSVETETALVAVADANL